MLKNKLWIGIILSIILLIFSTNGFAISYYKFTQESGDLFYVGEGDKADALEDTNELRQIVSDLGGLLVHSKKNDSYPKDATTGGTLSIPNSALASFATGAKGDLWYCSATNVWTKLNIGTDNQILVVATDVLNWETASSDLLSDVAYIAMLDEYETVTKVWTFTDNLFITRINDTQPPLLNMRRKRDGDPTDNVAENDVLGEYAFAGYYTDDFYSGGMIYIRVDGTPGQGDMPGRMEFWTTPDGSAAPVLRQTIDNAGNIKMGDGAWTNYINVTAGGALTLEGTANIEGVDATELSYLDGVTSDIQTQLDSKKGNNYYSALASDHTYSDNADTDTQPVGESVVFGDLLYFNWAIVTGTDIAFVDGGAGEDTITQVAAKFLEIGLVAGDIITVSGTTNNNGNHTIVSVVAGTINVATGTLVAEGAGASVTIISPYEWKKAKADASTTVPGLRIALETKANGEACLMLVKGYIRDDSAFDFAGAMIYVSEATAGAMTSTAPSTAGNQLQRVGQAKSADILFFDPSIDVGEI